MKLPRLVPAFLFCILFILLSACGNSEKKEKSDSSETAPQEEAHNSEETDIDLPQKGDYKKLFALDSQCKLTQEEIATLYSIPPSSVKETYSNTRDDGGTYCSYRLTLEDGTETIFGITTFKLPNIQVRDQISNWVTGSYEKEFLQISDSGDHYIWKHPHQSYYMVYNPSYANGIKIQYRTTPKMDETQKKYLQDKGVEAIEYLIETYKNK